MEWRDQGILLSTRRHGETSAIIDVFTPSHGRHSGIVRGGASKKTAPFLQPGAQLDVTWRARLESHIGTFTVEPIRSRAAAALGTRQALAGLNAVTSLVAYALPERQAHSALYAQTQALLDLLGQNEIWPLAYLRWEVTLLEELGFGLDLSACAVNGGANELTFIPPGRGRAVSGGGRGSGLRSCVPCRNVYWGRVRKMMQRFARLWRSLGTFSKKTLKIKGLFPMPARV